MAFLGFSAGLPLLLVFGTLSIWLRESGIERASIGFLSWVTLAYSIKVFWSPLVDQIRLPGLGRMLGLRRSWMLLAQAGVIAGIVGVALSDPGSAVLATAGFAVLIAFSSATQDIAIDAYRIEAVEPDLQGAMAATYSLGYRLAMVVAGAGPLYIAERAGWTNAYLTMAALMSVGVVTVLAIREPETQRKPLFDRPEVAEFLAARSGPRSTLALIEAWIYGAILCPFIEFFRRNAAFGLILLAFIALYRLSDITLGVMANVFYTDLGFSKDEIASVAKVFGPIMTIIGTFLGGALVTRFGIMPPLLLGAVLVVLTNLLFSVLATLGPELWFLTLTISADNLSAGIASAAFIAYLSSLTNQAYTATQYALFSSLMLLPGKFLAGWSGLVVDHIDYVNFFYYAAALGLPAILLAIWIMRRRPAPEPSPRTAAAE